MVIVVFNGTLSTIILHVHNDSTDVDVPTKVQTPKPAKDFHERGDMRGDHPWYSWDCTGLWRHQT